MRAISIYLCYQFGYHLCYYMGVIHYIFIDLFNLIDGIGIWMVGTWIEMVD